MLFVSFKSRIFGTNNRKTNNLKKIMSFQKCPVCYGSGLDPSSVGLVPCPVCRGTRIIDELTGQPPYKETTFTTKTCGNISTKTCDNINLKKE